MGNVQKRDSFRIVLARCLRYGVASVKVPARLALIGGLSFGIAAGVATFAAGSFFTNLIQQARDVYTVYRLTAERDELLAANERLEIQKASLEREYARKVEFHEDVKTKMVALERALKSAGALTLFGEKDRGRLAKESKEPTKSGSSLASILRAPQLSGNRKPEPPVSDDLSMSECSTGEACIKDARKQKISLSLQDEEDELFVAPADSAIDVEHQKQSEQELMSTLDFYLTALEKTPIGTPTFGRYSSGFGYRASPFSSRSSFHEGIDVSLPRGGTVVSTGAGVVHKVGYHNHYGLVIEVEHTPGLMTRYAHLSKAVVREGQRVVRGQRIGLSGASGRVTGPHVHYEVLFHGKPRNPKPFVTLADNLPDAL